MTNTVKLRTKVKASGLKYWNIAKQMNLTTYGLQRKIDNMSEFKSSEIAKFCEILGITSLEEKENIFFAN
ncbi:hypothetical protein [Hydrogenoanaerobacterium sp.]|uniref:hypothetical protein n=1 Tax=Hydrogenoanaerobacterium sp. TaxID=2953763 RepID=UPI00289C6541|nr:hypothetical protein [Hydrogenoanaerobacterium sp.]